MVIGANHVDHGRCGSGRTWFDIGRQGNGPVVLVPVEFVRFHVGFIYNQIAETHGPGRVLDEGNGEGFFRGAEIAFVNLEFQVHVLVQGTEFTHKATVEHRACNLRHRKGREAEFGGPLFIDTESVDPVRLALVIAEIDQKRGDFLVIAQEGVHCACQGLDRTRVRAYDADIDILACWRTIFFSPHADGPTVCLKGGKLLSHVIKVDDWVISMVIREILGFFCRHLHIDMAEVAAKNRLVVLVDIEPGHGCG